jgi:hypothetical protein
MITSVDITSPTGMSSAILRSKFLQLGLTTSQVRRSFGLRYPFCVLELYHYARRNFSFDISFGNPSNYTSSETSTCAGRFFSLAVSISFSKVTTTSSPNIFAISSKLRFCVSGKKKYTANHKTIVQKIKTI